jgi:ParB-like chromosome segregation protein Spo0J
MYEIKDVRLDLIDANPHRDLKTYPWMEPKVEQLMRSIDEVGFWASVIGRPQSRRYQLAFGHHRMEAAERLKLKTIPLIVAALSDQQMLQYMGRENGEDYSSDFLVMLNTWDGATKFLASSGAYLRLESRDSRSAKTAETLGWMTNHNNALRISHIAAACSAAQALIIGKHLSRADLKGLTVSEAREIVVRAQHRIDQLEQVGRREGHDPAQTKEAQRVVGQAARITAREVKEVAPRNLRNQVDLNTLRAVGRAAAPVRVPLFAVFGQALCDQIARMLAKDSAGERITEIEKALAAIELEEDRAVLRKLHHELDELERRAERSKTRTTPGKVVKLQAIETKGA